MKIIISKDIKSYFSGKADGIQFLNVSKEDAETLKSLAIKYGKSVELMDSIVSTYNPEDDTSTEDIEETISKPKEKKTWINNGSEVKRINVSELKEYLEKGYKIGKKKK